DAVDVLRNPVVGRIGVVGVLCTSRAILGARPKFVDQRQRFIMPPSSMSASARKRRTSAYRMISIFLLEPKNGPTFRKQGQSAACCSFIFPKLPYNAEIRSQSCE